jgi:hypothetical protein
MAGTCNDCGADTWGRYRICPDCRKDRKRSPRSYGSNRYSERSSGIGFWCKDCKYVWKTKKSVGRPAVCPRCNSKRIVFDLLLNLKLVWMITITAIAMFTFSRFFPGDPLVDVLGILGLIFGLMFVPVLIMVILTEHSKNKRILNSQNENILIEKEIKTNGIEKIKIFSLIVLIVLVAFFVFQNILETPPETTLETPNETTSENLPETTLETPLEPTLKEKCISLFDDGGIFGITNTLEFENYAFASSWLDEKYPDEGLTINLARRQREDYLDFASFPLIVVEGSKEIAPQITENGIYYCDSNGFFS